MIWLTRGHDHHACFPCMSLFGHSIVIRLLRPARLQAPSTCPAGLRRLPRLSPPCPPRPRTAPSPRSGACACLASFCSIYRDAHGSLFALLGRRPGEICRGPAPAGVADGVEDTTDCEKGLSHEALFGITTAALAMCASPAPHLPQCEFPHRVCSGCTATRRSDVPDKGRPTRAPPKAHSCALGPLCLRPRHHILSHHHPHNWAPRGGRPAQLGPLTLDGGCLPGAPPGLLAAGDATGGGEGWGKDSTAAHGDPTVSVCWGCGLARYLCTR
jgi:hypothetical protein